MGDLSRANPALTGGYTGQAIGQAGAGVAPHAGTDRLPAPLPGVVADQGRPISERTNEVREDWVGGPETPSSVRPRSLDQTYDDEYRIGASDVLEVFVWGEPDVSRGAVVVRRDGRITLPLVQDVRVAGLTPMEASDRIRERLEELYIEPRVTVIIQQFGSSSYYLMGQVAAPGEYPLLRETTVLQAIIRANGFRQVERSGQIIEAGDLSRILLIRDRGDGADDVFNLNLAGFDDGEALGLHARSNDMMLAPGDIVSVPERTRLAYVMGEVRAPGIVALGEYTTLLQALSERGGHLPSANLRKIWVVRRAEGQESFENYDLRKLLRRGDASDDIKLEAGDVVFIPKTLIGSMQEFVGLWSSTLQPAMSTYTQAWDTWYTMDRYKALRDTNFGSRRQEIIRRVENGNEEDPDF